ncbi:MAG: hypothetical protein DMF69_04685 [Acidobacteria bacterium]|nr:MAG: hypothetical protein DMF69_04685 [Acidobacteriota bacterium]
MLKSPVVPAVGRGGNTVVAPVARLMFVSVVCGRAEVMISLETLPELSLTVPASWSNDDESLTNVVPSARQNFSASSVSTRLH